MDGDSIAEAAADLSVWSESRGIANPLAPRSSIARSKLDVGIRRCNSSSTVCDRVIGIDVVQQQAEINQGAIEVLNFLRVLGRITPQSNQPILQDRDGAFGLNERLLFIGLENGRQVRLVPLW